ncbi:hypothetical protein DL96DRAFT_1663233, partial [Flagelloscypha sp. PMI_526]
SQLHAGHLSLPRCTIHLTLSPPLARALTIPRHLYAPSSPNPSTRLQALQRCCRLCPRIFASLWCPHFTRVEIVKITTASILLTTHSVSLPLL